MKSIIVCMAALLLSACTITQQVEPASLKAGSKICIVEDPKVKGTFLSELRSAIGDNGFDTAVISNEEIPATCTYKMTYMARWSWDGIRYMSFTDLKLFDGDQLLGSALYDSTGGAGNADKFIKATEKIKELVSELLQKQALLIQSRRHIAG